jgi:hypothetical protein
MSADHAPTLRADIERLARALVSLRPPTVEAIDQGVAVATSCGEKRFARLRRLIRRVLTASQPGFRVPCCGKPGPRHGGGCPWPALVAEAEKP